MQKYKELLGKYKKIILVSLIGVFMPVLFIDIFLVRNFLFCYLLIFGFLLVFLQKENSVKKILPGLFIGSFLSVLFLIIAFVIREFIINRKQAYAVMFNHNNLLDSFFPALILMGIIFFTGLIGVVLYGFYNLYEKQIRKYFIYFSPIVLTVFSFLIMKNDFGGTIMSRLYGWPFPMLKYNVKDIVDRTMIDQYIFLSSYVFNIILNYVFYFSFLFLLGVIFNYLKIKFKLKIDNFLFLFLPFVFIIFFFSTFHGWQKFMMQEFMRDARSCNVTADCKIVRDLYNDNAFTLVNADNYNKVRTFIYSFPYEFSTSGSRARVEPTCVNNRCTVKSFPLFR